MLLLACKRSLCRLLAFHGPVKCKRAPITSTMLNRSPMQLQDHGARTSSLRESAFGMKRNCYGVSMCMADDVCAGCHPNAMCQNGSNNVMESSSTSDDASPRRCSITREVLGKRQANVSPSVAGTKLDHDKTPNRSLDGQQGIHDDVGSPTHECDRTFCPPERRDHCPVADQGLAQPRGDLSLTHRLDGAGLQNLKRSLKCPRDYRALLVDAAGTLIDASQSTQEIYHEIGRKYGVQFSEEEIAAKYKAAYGQPWCRYRMRYEEDGRFFWQRIVQEATGCKDPGLLEDLYQYYTTEKAWHIADPDAEKALKAIRKAGVKVAVVSNFDTRLRPLMRVLRCYDWFDNIVVSAEVGLEKPNPEIFLRACRELGVTPEQALHVGDDEVNDIVGASEAGCDSLLWGVEVTSFSEVAKRLGVKV